MYPLSLRMKCRAPSSLFGAHFQKSSKIMEMTMEVATKKLQALSLLAAGSPLEKVANTLGVHRATLWRWKKDPKFVAEWNKMLDEMKERQTLALVKLQEESLNALYSCLNSKNDIVRLRAALSVMERVENLKVGCTDSDVIKQDREQNRRLQKMWEF